MKKMILLSFLLFLGLLTKAQVNTDSLWIIWQDENQVDSMRLEALSNLVSGLIYSHPDSALYLSQIKFEFAHKRGYKNHEADALITQGNTYWVKADYLNANKFYNNALLLYEEIGDKKGISASLNNIGALYMNQGQGERAIELFTNSLKIREEIGYKLGIATCLLNIGVIYGDQEGHENKAIEFYNKSLKIFQEIDYKQGIATAIGNIGEIYSDIGEADSALEYFHQSIEIYEEISDKQGMAWILRFMGDTYQNQNIYSKALEFYESSLMVNKEIGDPQGIAQNLMAMGNLYNLHGKHQSALVNCKRGLSAIKELGFIHLEKEGYQCLYDSYKALGNSRLALSSHEQMLVLSDSLQSSETVKKLQQMEFAQQILADSIAQVEKERLAQIAYDEEIKKKNRTKNIALGGGLLFMILAGGFFSRWRYIKKSRDIISKEKDRSENLLLNILPAEIAEELKSKGRADARDFERVSILFTDFQSFTEASAKLSAQDLVAEINICFEFFDGIVGKYGIEKIKTIGDAYMAAGGLPVPNKDSVKNTVLAALEMQAFISKRKVEMDSLDNHAFQMRVGIHTGPVVAGIVGVRKFQYDIWGDAVNTANRMESNGQIGKVNISKYTYELIKDDPQFKFESRGKVQTKGKGEIEMYFVERTAI